MKQKQETISSGIYRFAISEELNNIGKIKLREKSILMTVGIESHGKKRKRMSNNKKRRVQIQYEVD